MYHIIDKRATGKTMQLLILAKDYGATVVCRNPNVLREKGYAYGITGIDYISYNDYHKNPQSYDKILIDNLELCFPNMIGYTSTLED